MLADCERLEKQIGDNPADALYSDTWEKKRSYAETVLEIQNHADDFIFSLAGQKGETFESLYKKPVSDLMSFAERIIRENGRH